MTYASFLAVFLVVPLVLVALFTRAEARRGRAPTPLAWGALALHVLVAVVYTTPWDNHLVASRVWWYDPARVLGVTIGWVPLEEYVFFVLQTMLTGLVLLALLRRWPPGPAVPPSPAIRLRAASAAVALVAAGASLVVLAAGWRPGTYMALILAWALPPIALQLAVGADLLWRRRRAVLTTLTAAVLYLSAADAYAIHGGVWTIDPAQSLGAKLGGTLPIEEAVFFLVTNALIVAGMTLALSPETWTRWRRGASALRRRPDVGGVGGIGGRA